MRVLKYFLITVITLLLLIVGGIWLIAGNQQVLNRTIKTVVSQAGIPLHYESLSGDLLSGFSLKGVNYDDKVKADLSLKVDYPQLADGVVHVQKLHANNIWIDHDFLASLIDANSSSKSNASTHTNDFLKKILVDDLDISLHDTRYHAYEVKNLKLHVSDFAYDMDKKIDGKINLSLDSNVGAGHADIVARKSHYRGDIVLDPEKSYLQQFVQDQNMTIDRAPHIVAKVDGDLSGTAFDVRLHDTRLHYTTLAIAPELLHLKGNYDFSQNGLDADAILKGTSDAADYDLHLTSMMDLNHLNDTLTYHLNGDLKGAKPQLSDFLHEQNLSFLTPSMIHLDANGTMQQVNTNVHLKKGKIRYGAYTISPQYLNLKAKYDLNSSRLAASGEGEVLSNAADLNLTFQTKTDLNAPAKTLTLNLRSDLLPKRAFLSGLLSDQNITLQKIPQLHIHAVTAGKTVHATVQIDPLALRADDLTFTTRKLLSDVTLQTDTQKLHATLLADILSNAGALRLDANSSMKLTDINTSLRYSASGTLQAKEGYLKQHLKTQKVDFRDLSPLKVMLHGNAKALDATLNLSGKARLDRYYFAPLIKDTKLHYDLREHTLKSDLDLALKSTCGDLKLRGRVMADTDDINRTLRYSTALKIRQREPLFDLNLTQLGTLSLDLNGTLKNLNANLRSKKLKADVKSSDFDRFDFSLLSQKLYLDKLYLALPPKFRKSYAALDAKGSYALRAQKADVSMQLKRLHLSGRDISTNRFRFKMNGKDFRLTPLELRAKGFLMKLDATSKKGAVTAHLRNRAINADIAFREKPLSADAKVDIPSLKKLLHEVDKLYPIAPIPKVDGALSLTAKTAGKERIEIQLHSPKITLPEGRLEKVNILAYYQPERIDIPTFDFQLKGFKPKKMNRAVHLAHPAFIVLKEGAMQVDFVLKDFLSFKAEEKNGVLSGKLKTDRLYLGMKGYGETRLTTNVDFYKSGEQTAVSGDVILSDTVITYESRVLDVSQDPDIIIIKKSKRKAAADNSFIKNTFLDLHIKSLDEIEYKVEAGTIVLKPDIEVRKDFGSKVKLLGKIRILEGEYDLGDKRFEIKEGAVAFRGLEEINPHLDLHVEYPIEDVIIYIDILGDKRKPKLQFKSKPMMSKKDIFSYLLFGFAVSESEGAQSSAANAAEKIFGRALAKDLARELKLDRLDLTRNALGGINIKAGKKVNKKTIIYYQNKDAQSSAIVERKLSRHLDLDVEAGQDSQAIDLLFRKGFK